MSVWAPPASIRVNVLTRSAVLFASAQQVGICNFMFTFFTDWFEKTWFMAFCLKCLIGTFLCDVFRFQWWNLPNRHRWVLQHALLKRSQMYRPTQWIWLWMCWRWRKMIYIWNSYFFYNGIPPVFTIMRNVLPRFYWSPLWREHWWLQTTTMPPWCV